MASLQVYVADGGQWITLCNNHASQRRKVEDCYLIGIGEPQGEDAKCCQDCLREERQHKALLVLEQQEEARA